MIRVIDGKTAGAGTGSLEAAELLDYIDPANPHHFWADHPRGRAAQCAGPLHRRAGDRRYCRVRMVCCRITLAARSCLVLLPRSSRFLLVQNMGSTGQGPG